MTEMTINGVDISKYGARLLDVNISATKINKIYNDTYNAYLPQVSKTYYGTKDILITLVFANQAEKNRFDQLSVAAEYKSDFDAILAKSQNCELWIPQTSDWYYTSNCVELGTVTYADDYKIEAQYQFMGVCHSAMVTLQSKSTTENTITGKIDGNLPMPCIISLTPTAATDITLNITNYSWVPYCTPFTLKAVPAGATVVIDGYKKTIMCNGANYARNCSFIDFPVLQGDWTIFKLTPTNAATNKINMTVQYYPSYI